MAGKRGTKANPTLKQQRAIDGFLAVIKGRENKSFIQVLEDAGYAPESAKQWSNVMEGIRPHLQPALHWLELHRTRVMQRMDEKVGTADYAELTRSLDIITKSLQLLQNKPTNIFKLTDKERTQLDELIDD